MLIHTKRFLLINEEIKVKVDEDIFNFHMDEDMHGVEEAQSSHFGNERSDDSSSEESVNVSNNDDGGSEDEFVPETTGDNGSGGGSVREEEMAFTTLAQNRECFGLDNKINYPQGKRKIVMGIKGGTIETCRGNSAVSTSKEVESSQRKNVSPRIVTCPTRCRSSGVRNGSYVDKGLALVGPLSLGLLSFDEACSNSKKFKPIIKKVKDVKSLGKKVEGFEAHQSYFAYLNPKFAPKFYEQKITYGEEGK